MVKMKYIAILTATFLLSDNSAFCQNNLVDLNNTTILVDGLIVFNDYDLGIIYAKKTSKLILIYFNSKLSSNCRKIEKNIFSDSKVKEYLNKKFLVINLYVDDKSFSNKSPFNTVGEYNSNIELSKFKTDLQPFLVILNSQNKFIKSIGYISDPKVFLKFLSEK